MKQVIQNFRSGELKVDEVPAPTARGGGLLVANQFSLISAGTEKSTVDVARKSLAGKAMDRPDQVRKVLDKAKKDGVVDTMKMVFSRLDTPATLGYSCTGIVVEAGRDTEGFTVGDRVACAGQNYASHAEYVWVPKNLCVKVPEGVAGEDAAFVTLGAIALQGVRQAEPRLGDRVAVIGLGLLGQLTVQMLKANGCFVIAADIAKDKLELAKTFGADLAVHTDELAAQIDTFTGGHGVDAVIITASTRENGPVETAGEIARKKGRVVVVGAVGMNIPRESYYTKELELRLSTSYGPGRYDKEYEEKGRDYPYGYVRWTENRNMEAFLQLIGQGRIDTQPLISHRYPIEQADSAYKLMLDNTEPYLGILLSYPGDTTNAPVRRVEMRDLAPAEQVNLGIIGAGNHVKDMLLPQLKPLKGVQLRAICTGTGANARALAEKIGAAYCSSDYQQVLEDDSVNAVLIGTRHNSHGRMVRDALRAGKHVFVEKPLCLTEQELEEITAAHADSGRTLMVGFNRRFSPHADRARDFFAGRSDPLVMCYRVNAGSIPADHWIQDPESGGGRIIGEACHFIDYMQAVCGAPPVSVSGQRIAAHSSGILDDQSIMLFGFADGSVGSVIYAAGGSTAMPKERFEAFGGGKSLVMDDFMVTEFYDGHKRSTFKTRKRDKGFQAEMAAFVDAIISGSATAMPFDEIAAVTRASILAAMSLRTGESYDV